MKSLSRFSVFLGLAVAVLSGCGGSDGKVPVSGTLMHKGQPVGDAVIVFYPEGGGRPVSAESGSDGKFRFPQGAPVGKHKVTLAASTPTMEGEPEPAQPGEDPYAVEDQPTLPVPEKYRDPSTSDLTVEVPEGGLSEYTLDVPE